LATYYRHISKGAWPFSSRDHGWPISDCTSEGFKAALGLAALGQPDRVGPSISRERLEEAVQVILSYQNSDGGMATYENTRSFHSLEVGQPDGPGLLELLLLRAAASAAAVDAFLMAVVCSMQWAAATSCRAGQ
jgi:hypothetical protein